MVRRSGKYSVAEAFGQAQADFRAAKRHNKHRPRRAGIPAMGAGADYHYRSEADYLWMGEYSRDLDRNDPVLGSLKERAIDNVLQEGLTPDPETGDTGLDEEFKARWQEKSVDPKQCDLSGEMTFQEQTRVIASEMVSPGDIFALNTLDGPTQLVEQHLCRQPSTNRSKRNIVLGVELDAHRRRQNYYFTKDQIDPMSHAKLHLKDLRQIPAFSPDGEPLVLHCYAKKRPSQTRGVSAYAPILDMCGMLDDLNFTQLLKAQMSSMILAIRNRSTGFDPATAGAAPPVGRNLNISAPGETRKLEGVGPLTEMTSLEGEEISINSSNIPNSEYFPHVRLILTLIGINLGMPLIFVTMDGSETNFSGWRGASDQAKQGFRRWQKIIELRWCRPSYIWDLNRWADEDPALARRRDMKATGTFDYFRHKWSKPRWPYIQPEQDAKADLIRLANMLTSPQRLFSEKGDDAFEIGRETILYRSTLIGEAIDAAKKLGPAVSWKDLLPLPMPQSVSLSLQDEIPTSGVSANAN